MAGIPANLAFSMLAVEAGVSLICADSFSSPVTIELADVPAERAFRDLALAAGAEVAYEEGTVRVMTLEQAPRYTQVIPAGFLESPLLADALDGTINGAEVKPAGDSILVTGTASQVRRTLETVGSGLGVADGWLLTVEIIASSAGLRDAIGLTPEVGIVAGVDFAAALGGTRDATLRGSAGVAGSAAASFVPELEALGASLIHSASMFVLEGRESRLELGEVIPVPQRTVSPEGTVSISGYSQVRAGLLLKLEGRRVGTSLLLTCESTLSSVSGYVEEAPIVAQRVVTGSLVLAPGQMAVFAGLGSVEVSETKSGLPGIGFTGQTGRKDEREFLVLVTAKRVVRGSDVLAGLAP